MSNFSLLKKTALIEPLNQRKSLANRPNEYSFSNRYLQNRVCRQADPGPNVDANVDQG